MAAKNLNFVKTEISSLNELAALAVVYPSASALLAVLKALVANERTVYGGVMVSNNILQKLTNTTKATVVKSAKILTEGGFIGIGKCGRNNVYIVNHELLSMTKTGKENLTYTALDNVRIMLDDGESLNIVMQIKKLQGRSTKEYKAVRKSRDLNSLEVKHSKNMTTNSNIYVDKTTGEDLSRS